MAESTRSVFLSMVSLARFFYQPFIAGQEFVRKTPPKKKLLGYHNLKEIQTNLAEGL